MNDWIVANINNSDFSISDFKNIADMSINNTQMLKRDEYLKSDYIKNNPLFLDELGKFSEDKFNLFYDLKLSDFLKFQTGDFPDGLELDMFDTDRTKDSRVRDDQFFIGRHENPDRLKVGIEGINVWSNPEKSKSELAQMSKIWDTENEEFKDYSPNDKALFNGLNDFGLGWLSSLFEDPLVLAQWEEEGEHIDPVTGLLKKHAKGDYKLNLEGTYYYETLNNRSPIGKQTLSILDTITVDGTGINKYDFFDSDDIEKSVGGVIAKNVASLLPIFLGGLVGLAYSTALIAREMLKSLPMLHGVLTMFGDSEAPRWVNSFAAMGEKFTGGSSLYAKEHTFSVENFGNLISDVALLWGQLKAIAHAIDKLRGNQNLVDKAVDNAKALYDVKKKTMGALAALDDVNWLNSPLGLACLKKFVPDALKAAVKAGLLGRDISLGYMAIISNSDVFGDMIQHGATKSEAAAVALGSTIGMFAVDKTGLGEVFFDDATDSAVKLARQAIKTEIREARDAFNTIKSSTDTNANKLLKYIKLGAEKGKHVVNLFRDDLKYHTTNFYLKAIAEGIEEVSEELVSDAAKSIYELAGKLGADTTVKDVGAWDNALERYTMSFLGGAIGGGIFYGKEVLHNGFKHDKSNEETATLIRNGHTAELRDELNKLRTKGKAGSTKLSAYDYELSKDGPVWLTTTDRKRSQNDRIADMIEEKITALEAVINNNQMNLSDDLLFSQMVLSEDRYLKYKEVAPITNYYLDFNDILMSLVEAEGLLKVAQTTIDGTHTGATIADNSLKSLTDLQKNTRALTILQYQDKVDKLREKRNNFLSGITSLDYTRKLNFAMDEALHREFIPISTELLWKKHFLDKSIEQATEEDLKKFFTEILPLEKSSLMTKKNLTDAWERFKQIERVIVPELLLLSLNAPQFKLWSDKFLKIVESGVLSLDKLLASYIKVDDKLDGETDELYLLRNTKGINPITGVEETDEEFKLRKKLRDIAIDKINDLKDLEWVNAIKLLLAIVGGNVDPISARILRKLVPFRLKDVISRKIDMSKSLNSTLKNFLKLLKNDLSNKDEVWKILKLAYITLDKTKDAILDKISTLTKSSYTSPDGDSIILLDVFNPDSEMQEFFANLTVGQVLNDPSLLIDPDGLDEASVSSLVEQLTELLPIVGDNISMGTLINENGLIDFDAALNGEKNTPFSDLYTNYKNHVLQNLDILLNEVESVVSDISTNAFFDFGNSFKETIKNPVIEMVKSLSGKVLDLSTVPQIEDIIAKIEDNYENIDDISMLELDDVLLDALHKTRDAINLIKTYLYAASTTSHMNLPIGHNKMINEFARNHRDLVENWEELAELDEDFGNMYTLQLTKYANSINSWIDFSNKNSVNKRALFERMDKAFSSSLWKMILKLLDTDNFKVDVDDKHYDLLKGISSITSNDNVAIPLFEAEKLLYKNFLEALYDSGLSVSEFLNKTGLLGQLSKGNISLQKSARITPNLSEDHLTDFDVVLYFAQAFTLNPVDYYGKLKAKVAKDVDTAPITLLEYAARVAIAATNLLFKDIMTYAFNKSGDLRYNAANTVVIMGPAGAGKTLAVIKSLKDYYDPSEILAAGPTETLATTLLKALGVGSSLTIEKLLRNILGDDLYLKIKSAINKLELWSDDDVSKYLGDTEYFTAYEGLDGFAKYKINPEKIKFDLTVKIPKLVVIDEATHLSSVEALILDTYMKTIGGTLVLAGDLNQRGYVKESMGNIRNVDFFAARTPKLVTSLRDNNILKQANLLAIQSLLNQVLDNLEDMTKSLLKGYWPTAMNLLSKLNFKVYNELEINGDLITGSLTSDLIAKIKKEGKTVGFVGNKSSSAAYAALKSAGVVVTAMTPDEIQGQEFDFVIIDLDFEKPSLDFTIRDFLQNVYTLMSRGREASIFIDNGLSDIIGKNVVSLYQAKAPSLTDKINGKSAIEDLRQKKIATLSLFDLTPMEIKGVPTSTNTDLDFVNPENVNLDKELELAFKEEMLSVLEDLEELEGNLTIDPSEFLESDFTIPSFGNVTYLSVQTSELERADKNGKKHKAPLWKISKKGEILRNLNALKGEDEEAFWYSEKLRWLNELYQVKSWLIYQHKWDDLRPGTGLFLRPSVITNNFTKEDWNEGTYELEIREADEVTPIFALLPKVGMEYNGKKYIADIVFKVKNKWGLTCVFDLTGINNPDTLIKNLDKIKTNIKAKLAKGKLSLDEIKKLNNILGTIDGLAAKYKSLFDSWINLFEKNGSFSLNISNVVKFNKTTWFTKRKDKGIRLGGMINPESVDAKDFNDLKSRSPGMVFSDIYTYASKEALLADLSIRGKAVVFVSSDTTLNPEDLVLEWINQKTKPEEHTPRVRMLVLNNYGMYLSLLYDPEFIKAFLSGNDERKPLRLNFLGILMFTSMWNWRASLKLFNEALRKWKETYGYNNEEVVSKIIKAHYHIFNNKLIGDAKIKYLQSVGLTQEDINNLETFNLEDLKQIPTFRLGYSINEDNGFHIENRDVTGSNLYGKEAKANLIMITPEKAQTFLNMTEKILKSIVSSDERESLGLRLLKDDNKTPWKEDELIDLLLAKHRRSLSNLLKFDNATKELTILFDGKRIAYTEGTEWSSIPMLIGSLIKTITYYLYNPELLSGSGQETARIYLHNRTNGTDREAHLFNTTIGTWFLGDNPILKTRENTKAAPTKHPDRSLVDMLELMFHGTTDDIKKNLTEGLQLLLATDARFPNGFLINPDVSRKKDSASADSKVIGPNLDGLAIFYNIETNEGLFISDVDLRASGISLSLADLESNVNKQKEEEISEERGAEENVNTFELRYPVASSLIDRANRLGEEFESSVTSILEVADFFNKKELPALMNTLDSKTEEEALITTVHYNVVDGQDLIPITLQQYIELLVLLHGHSLKDIKIKLGKLEIHTDSGVYSFDKNYNLELKELYNALNTTRFSRKLNFEGKLVSVLSAIGKLLKDSFGKIEDWEGNTVSDELINEFQTKLNGIITNSRTINDEQVLNLLEDLKDFDDGRYDDIVSYIENINEDLYEMIFGC